MAITGYLQTVEGAVSAEDFGVILPHEHLFTDLRGPSAPDCAQADLDDVVRAITPLLEDANKVNVTALVECSTDGVGRNPHILKALSETTPIHIIAPTGVYKEDYIPEWMRSFTAQEMAELWIQDLTSGIEDTKVKAGFIKIAMSDDGPRPIEVKALLAAAIASNQTGAVVASHTPNGEIFRKQRHILEEVGLPPHKFIWAHANLEKDKDIHLEAAKEGFFVEFDAIGADWQSQEAMVDYTIALIAAGYTNYILLSHDAGWYQPGRPNGEPEGGFRGFTAMADEFLLELRSRGVAEEMIRQITHHNPVSAFAFDSGV